MLFAGQIPFFVLFFQPPFGFIRKSGLFPDEKWAPFWRPISRPNCLAAHGFGAGRALGGHALGTGELEPAPGWLAPGPVVCAAHQLVECAGTTFSLVEQDHQVRE